MNVTDNSLFLMKIEHHQAYNLQIKITPCRLSTI